MRKLQIHFIHRTQNNIIMIYRTRQPRKYFEFNSNPEEYFNIELGYNIL